MIDHSLMQRAQRPQARIMRYLQRRQAVGFCNFGGVISPDITKIAIEAAKRPFVGVNIKTLVR